MIFVTLSNFIRLPENDADTLKPVGVIMLYAIYIYMLYICWF